MLHKKSPPQLILAMALTPGLAYSATQILAPFTPTLDGNVDAGSTHLTELPAAAPIPGGSPTNSDFIGETAANHWIDSGSGATHNLGSNRGDIQQFYVSVDSTNLYLSLTGPQVSHNLWTGPSGGSAQTNGDQGDIWIAIDTANTAAGNLTANSTPDFAGGSGVRAVDFTGWSPTHFIGVQYVDNGGGGGGGAGFVGAGVGATITTESQNIGNGGFDWYTNGGDGLEFVIPWASLGLSGEDVLTSGDDMRFGAYTTQNFGGADVYDQGPGQGNGGPFEQIGDFVGDTDGGLPGGDSDNDGGGTSGTQPGSNFVAVPGSYTVGNGDEIDTIGEYWEISFIPEPSSALLTFLGLAGLTLRRRRS